MKLKTGLTKTAYLCSVKKQKQFFNKHLSFKTTVFDSTDTVIKLNDTGFTLYIRDFSQLKIAIRIKGLWFEQEIVIRTRDQVLEQE